MEDRTMNKLRTTSLQRILRLSCCVALLAPTAARGDGSTVFNGTSSPSGGTSIVQNASADLLAGSNDITICAWVYPTGDGEQGLGTIVALDEAGSGIRLQNYTGSNLAFASQFSTPGLWQFPVANNTWSAVAVTYNKSNTTNVPASRVNFATVSTTPEVNPSGTPPSVNTGYCIG
jgi:hypothetical protein